MIKECFCHLKSLTERQMYHSDTRGLLDSSQHKHLEKMFVFIKDKTAMTKHFFDVTYSE